MTIPKSGSPIHIVNKQLAVEKQLEQEVVVNLEEKKQEAAFENRRVKFK